MSNLTLEQCRKLKDWGFPQDQSEEVWLVPGEGSTPELRGLSQITDYRTEYYACPDLEALLEWGDEKTGGIDIIVLEYHSRAQEYQANTGIYELEAVYALLKAEAPTRIEAVYALLEEVLG